MNAAINDLRRQQLYFALMIFVMNKIIIVGGTLRD